MAKPATLDGYDEQNTRDCERVLVTLLRGLGPWKESVFLIGGLTPRFLVAARPPAVPPHAGTLDVDVVIALQVLADTEAYRTLEENLKHMGFERATNAAGQKQSWRWQARNDRGAVMVLELLAESPAVAAGQVRPLPTEGMVSALNIPHASIVYDLHATTTLTAELLGGNGLATETIRHADIVGFTCLKALAFDHRNERKDAHDLTYCLEHAASGFDGVVAAFRAALSGRHGPVVRRALDILRLRFTGDGTVEGYRRDGPIAVAKFELGEGDDADSRDARALRQRDASDLIERLLAALG